MDKAQCPRKSQWVKTQINTVEGRLEFDHSLWTVVILHWSFPPAILYLTGMHWQKITLVGVGLLGGSLGLAIKERRLAAKVDGFVRRSVSICECEKLGVV